MLSFHLISEEAEKGLLAGEFGDSAESMSEFESDTEFAVSLQYQTI